MYSAFESRQRSVYQGSLTAQELRLLRPLHFSQHFIHFEVATFRRSALPKYTAVSYTWGSEDATETIFINGCKFSVRPNLWSCLYYLSQAAKSQDYDLGWDYLWVDAICINQDDNQEKSAQVRCMDQTYKDASCVSVWLGLPALPEHIQIGRTSNAPIHTFEVDPYESVDNWSDLANRPYWSRYWVIQEFLLGQNLWLYCGCTRMDWSDFQDLVYREEDIQYNSLGYDALPSIPPNASAAVPLLMGRSVDKFPEMPQPFHILLIQHRNSQCKDPRDRVFALLGLVSQEEKSFLGRYFPDYTLPERHVLTITLAHLTQYSSLEYGLTDITPESEDIFQGLGVASKRQRRELLQSAARIDYIGFESGAEALSMLVFHDQLGLDGLSDSVQGSESNTRASHSPGSNNRRPWTLAMGLLGAAAGAAAIFWFWNAGQRLKGVSIS
ncbi:hypothetical protein PG999_007527 [Apiospora kogelbergensis]|uniref:Heterokaryon incompatibility domain-containing protein n=1 Tax=Apiospora kogelbergensis TaxID=1337665 RepID=A0AAW0QVK8_9PEZI